MRIILGREDYIYIHRSVSASLHLAEAVSRVSSGIVNVDRPYLLVAQVVAGRAQVIQLAIVLHLLLFNPNRTRKQLKGLQMNNDDVNNDIVWFAFRNAGLNYLMIHDYFFDQNM